MASDDSTRTFDTVHGQVSYTELNDLIAEPYRQTLDAVLDGRYDREPLTVDLLRSLHARFVGPVMPEIAGVWRSEAVVVGAHEPPAPRFVDYEMRAAFDALQSRTGYAGTDPDLQLEALAYAECAFLHVHPFKDFNGRAVRLFCWLVAVRHFALPITRTWVEVGTPAAAEYRSALRDYDTSKNVFPMKRFWIEHRVAHP